MATRGGGVGSGKEREKKKGSNPLNPQPKKTTTKPSTTSSPEHKPASSQKPLPNYLKPTMSSSLDFSPRRATVGGSTAATKPAHNRKNSSDKPPAPIQVQKDLPEIKNPRLPKKPLAQRSHSSLSARSVKTTGPPVLRRSASTKVSPASSSNSSNVKSVVARKAGPKSVTSESSVELEARERDPLDQMIGSGDEAGHLSDQREVLSLSDISEMPGQEEQLGDPSNTVQEVVDSKTTQSEVKVVEKVDDQGNDASHENLKEETVESPHQVDQGVEEKHVVVEVAVEESKEGKEVNLPATPVKLESPVKQVQSGKKEVQAYNDVIEETASKLMENKRNKVRALAGAFETVISLQDK